MKNITKIGGNRNREVHRVCGTNVSHCVRDFPLRIQSPNHVLSRGLVAGSVFGLRHNLALREGDGQRRQSGDSILVQEDRNIRDLWCYGLYVDSIRGIQVATRSRWCPDCGSVHILVGGGKQPFRLGKTSQEISTLVS